MQDDGDDWGELFVSVEGRQSGCRGRAGIVPSAAECSLLGSGGGTVDDEGCSGRMDALATQSREGRELDANELALLGG